MLRQNTKTAVYRIYHQTLEHETVVLELGFGVFRLYLCLGYITLQMRQKSS